MPYYAGDWQRFRMRGTLYARGDPGLFSWIKRAVSRIDLGKLGRAVQQSPLLSSIVPGSISGVLAGFGGGGGPVGAVVGGLLPALAGGEEPGVGGTPGLVAHATRERKRRRVYRRRPRRRRR